MPGLFKLFSVSQKYFLEQSLKRGLGSRIENHRTQDTRPMIQDSGPLDP